MKRGVLVLSTCAAVWAGDRSVDMATYIQENWKNAAAPFSDEKSQIDHDLAGKGQACSSAQPSQENAALLEFTTSFFWYNLNYAQLIYAAGDTVNRGEIILNFRAYDDSLSALVARKICSQIIEPDSIVLNQIYMKGLNASNELAGFSPVMGLTQKPKAVPIPFRFRYDLRGRALNAQGHEVDGP